MNRTKTVILLATLTAVLVWAGDALGGQTGLLTALVFAGIMNVGAYWWSDKLILRMYGAQDIVNPFSGSGMLRLFSTHPSTEQRVARLELLARDGLAALR